MKAVIVLHKGKQLNLRALREHCAAFGVLKESLWKPSWRAARKELLFTQDAWYHFAAFTDTLRKDKKHKGKAKRGGA